MTYAALLAQSARAEIGLATFTASAWALQRLTGSTGWIAAISTFGVRFVGVALALVFGAIGDVVFWRVVMVVAFAGTW